MFDDRELWKQISAGNADAFETWYGKTAPRLRSFLRHLTGSESAADDLMQETYTHIWRRPDGFDPDRGTLRAWLYGIARKQAAEWWRRQRPSDPLPEDRLARPTTETNSILATPSTACRPTTAHCSGCAKWKATRTPSSLASSMCQSALSAPACSPHAKRCAMSGTAPPMKGGRS